MGENIFNTFDRVAAGEGGRALWAARAPYRPEPDFDLMLIPRLPKGADWRESAFLLICRFASSPTMSAPVPDACV